MVKGDRGCDAGFWTVHRHDARRLEELFDVHRGPRPLLTTTITSPPYGALKDYGHERQIGFGQTYDAYLEEMEAVFGQIHALTKDDGSLWLIADTYMAAGRAPRRLLPVPFDLARCAEAAGFTLRDVIIWEKDRTLPWSNGTRLRNAFEYVLFFAKGPKTKYRLDRLRDFEDLKEWWARFPERYNPNGKAPSNVWRFPIPKQGSWGEGEIAHDCPLPPDLVERLILLSSDEDDVVLDPFAGSGVVVAEAERLGRLGVGTELVDRHVDEFERIIKPEILARGAQANGDASASKLSTELLVHLRMLKLPVVLMRRAARRRGAWPLAAFVFPQSRRRLAENLGAVRLVFVLAGATATERRAYRELIEELASVPPASKFGLQVTVEVRAPRALVSLAAGRRVFLYRRGSTSRALEAVPHRDLAETLAACSEDPLPPVLSNLHVDVPPRSESELRQIATAQAASATN